jgi:hypothetical protein
VKDTEGSGEESRSGRDFAAEQGRALLSKKTNHKNKSFEQKHKYECNQTAGASPKDDTKPADKDWQMDGKFEGFGR